MLRSTAIIAIVLLIGCNSPTSTKTNQATLDANQQTAEMANSKSGRTFDGSDQPHALRTTALVHHLFEKQYRLAESTSEPGVPFAKEHVAAFLRTGQLPDSHELRGLNNIRWSIDGRTPRHDPAVPDTPWYYDQSYLRGNFEEPFSSEVIARMKTEWNEISVAFGSNLCDAGCQLLDITAIVLASPERYKSIPYIDIRADEASTFAEFLAFADGYWLHAFVTEWRAPDTQSIVTLSFTPQCSDRHAMPPKDRENLLMIDLFNDPKNAR